MMSQILETAYALDAQGRRLDNELTIAAKDPAYELENDSIRITEAQEACMSLERTLREIPATSIQDLAIKARFLEYTREGKIGIRPGEDSYSEDMAAYTLARDLERMAGFVHPPAQGSQDITFGIKYPLHVVA